MIYGQPDGYGRYGILEQDDDGRLLCHECGQWWQHLATHARLAHDITAAEYRHAHGLGTTTRLVGLQARERMAAAYDRHRDTHLAALERSRNPREAVAQSLSHRGGQWAPEVRAKRRAAGRASRSVDLTPPQLDYLGDDTDLQQWADRARRLLTDGVTQAALARAADITPAAVAQRLRRYPAR